MGACCLRSWGLTKTSGQLSIDFHPTATPLSLSLPLTHSLCVFTSHSPPTPADHQLLFLPQVHTRIKRITSPSHTQSRLCARPVIPATPPFRTSAPTTARPLLLLHTSLMPPLLRPARKAVFVDIALIIHLHELARQAMALNLLLII